MSGLIERHGRGVVQGVFHRGLSWAAGMAWYAAILMWFAGVTVVSTMALQHFSGPAYPLHFLHFDGSGALAAARFVVVACIKTLLLAAMIVLALRVLVRRTYPDLELIMDDAALVALLAPYTARQRWLLLRVATWQRARQISR